MSGSKHLLALARQRHAAKGDPWLCVELVPALCDAVESLEREAEAYGDRCERLEARVAELEAATKLLHPESGAVIDFAELVERAKKDASARVAELEKELDERTKQRDHHWQNANGIMLALDLRQAEVDRLRTENAGLRKSLQAAQEEGDELRQPFQAWADEIWKEIEAHRWPQHLFIQSPDGAVLTNCLRCRVGHPDAARGCLENLESRARAAEARAEAAEGQLNEARASMATPLRELQQLTQEREKRCRDEKGCDHELLRRLQGLLGRFGYAHDVALPAPPTVEPSE